MTEVVRSLVAQIRDLLRQGMNPGTIGLTVVLGLLISVFPVVGVPTLLCLVAAFGLRLNLPLIQAVNYAGTPLQWLMLIPFLRLGEWITGAEHLPLTLPQIRNAIESKGIGFFAEYLGAGLHAALGWLIVCLVVLGFAIVANRGYSALRGRARKKQVVPLLPCRRV